MKINWNDMSTIPVLVVVRAQKSPPHCPVDQEMALIQTGWLLEYNSYKMADDVSWHFVSVSAVQAYPSQPNTSKVSIYGHKLTSLMCCSPW